MDLRLTYLPRFPSFSLVFAISVTNSTPCLPSGLHDCSHHYPHPAIDLSQHRCDVGARELTASTLMHPWERRSKISTPRSSPLRRRLRPRICCLWRSSSSGVTSQVIASMASHLSSLANRDPKIICCHLNGRHQKDGYQQRSRRTRISVSTPLPASSTMRSSASKE